MPLQTLYNQLQVLARKNPMLTMEDGSEISDPCHSTDETEPPVCLSPQDLEDPLAQEIVLSNGKGEKKLGPMQILEAYRQLVRMDAGDGKFDGLLSALPAIPQGSLIFSPKGISATRFLGKYWMPPQRLQTFLKFFEGRLSEVLPPVHPLFEVSRSSVEQSAQSMVDISYPLSDSERNFIEETARDFERKGFPQAAQLVSALNHRTRIHPYQPAKNAPRPNRGQTMVFRHHYYQKEGQKVEASVFLTAILPPNKKRGYFYDFQHDLYRELKKPLPLRGLTPRSRSLQRLDHFVQGISLDDPSLYGSHLPEILNDAYVYRYLSYQGPKGELSIAPKEYTRWVLVHEAHHAGAAEKAPTIALDERSDNFEWDEYGRRLSQPFPPPTETESLLNTLANILMLKRGALETTIRYKQRLDVHPEMIRPENIESQRKVTQLLTLADETMEFLIDEAAWRMTLAPLSLAERNLGSDRQRILNPNEEKIPAK